MRLYWGDPFFVSLFKRPSREEEAAVVARGQRLGFNYDCPGASRDLLWPDEGDEDRAGADKHRRGRHGRRRASAASAPLPLPIAAQADARDNGAWAVDRARVKVGYGRDTYLQTRDLVRRWGPFQLPWAQVAPDTPTRPWNGSGGSGSGSGSGVCVAARLLGGLVWTAVPLRVTVCEEQRRWPVLQLQQEQERDGTAAAAGAGAAAAAEITPTMTRKRRGRRFLLAHGCLRSHFLAGEERFAVEWHRDGKDDDDRNAAEGGPVYFEVATFSRPAHPLAALGYPVVRGLQAAFRCDSLRHVARAAAVATVDRSTGGIEAAGPWWETELPSAGGWAEMGGKGGGGGGGSSTQQQQQQQRGGWAGVLAGLVAGAGAAGTARAAEPASPAQQQRRRRQQHRPRRGGGGGGGSGAPSCACCGGGAF